MLRSIAGAGNRVSQRLNAGRAMPLCWMANRLSKARSIARLCPKLPPEGESMDRGTPNPPMNPMAYRNVAKNTA